MSEAARSRITAKRPLTALITGASSGIGKAFSELLAEKGHDVILVARREELMKEIAEDIEDRFPTKATVIVADLSDPSAPASVVARVEELGLEVDVLINNAGYTMDGHFLSYDWEQHRAYQQVMCLTPAELTYRFLRGMLRREFGQVINVASVAGLMPSTPFNALYGPSKQHMITLTRTLQIEYGKAGVNFSAVCPGPTAETSIIETQHGAAWARFTFLLSSTRDVAEKAYAAVEKGKTVQPVGPSTRASAAIGRFVPTDLWSKAAAQGIMFLGKEKPITSAAEAGIED
jgi:uncharacterized protein